MSVVLTCIHGTYEHGVCKLLKNVGVLCLYFMLCMYVCVCYLVS